MASGVNGELLVFHGESEQRVWPIAAPATEMDWLPIPHPVQWGAPPPWDFDLRAGRGLYAVRARWTGRARSGDLCKARRPRRPRLDLRDLRELHRGADHVHHRARGRGLSTVPTVGGSTSGSRGRPHRGASRRLAHQRATWTGRGSRESYPGRVGERGATVRRSLRGLLPRRGRGHHRLPRTRRLFAREPLGGRGWSQPRPRPAGVRGWFRPLPRVYVRKCSESVSLLFGFLRRAERITDHGDVELWDIVLLRGRWAPQTRSIASRLKASSSSGSNATAFIATSTGDSSCAGT